MEAATDILSAIWPSLADFAEAMGVTYGAARQMRRRGSIPVKYWPALIRDAANRGYRLTEAELVAFHTLETEETT